MQNQICSYNLPLFDDDKTMYFNDTILYLTLTNRNINFSEVNCQNLIVKRNLSFISNAPPEYKTWS